MAAQAEEVCRVEFPTSSEGTQADAGRGDSGRAGGTGRCCRGAADGQQEPGTQVARGQRAVWKVERDTFATRASSQCPCPREVSPCPRHSEFTGFSQPVLMAGAGVLEAEGGVMEGAALLGPG